jgi:molecular chaperone DnaK (HSP70)
MGILSIDYRSRQFICAYQDSFGVMALLPDRLRSGEFGTPAVVAFSEEGGWAGVSARLLAEYDFRCASAANLPVHLSDKALKLSDADGHVWNVTGLTALLFKKIVQDFQTVSGGEAPETVWLAVPEDFSAEDKKTLREASQIAGLSSIRFVERAIAAATHYGLEQQMGQNLFVLDLDDAGVEMSLLATNMQGIEPVAQTRLDSISADKMEARLQDLMAWLYAEQVGKPAGRDHASQLDIARAAQELLEYIYSNPHKPFQKLQLISNKAIEVEFTVEDAQAFLSANVLALTDAIEKFLKKSGYLANQIEEIVVTGNAAGCENYRRCIADLFACPVSKLKAAKPSQVVALGALMHANQQTGGGSKNPGKKLSRSACEIGVSIYDRKTQNIDLRTLIAKNSELPATAKTTLYTNRADQNRMILQLGQRVDATGGVIDLGFFEFGPIERPRKNYPVEITVSCDIDGVVTASAYDPETGMNMSRLLSEDGQVQAQSLNDQKSWIRTIRIND